MACDLCSVYSATQARGEVGEGLYAGLAEQFSHFATVQVDGRKVSNEAGQYLDSSISQLFAGYNLNSRFGVQFNLPVIYRSFKRPEGFEINRGTESGIGDVSLIGNFLAYRTLTENFTFSWSVLGGIKFPTGSTDRIKEEFNEVEVPGAPESGIHGHDLTLGTGSFDGIVGTGIFTRWRRLFLTANAQYAIRSKGGFELDPETNVLPFVLPKSRMLGAFPDASERPVITTLNTYEPGSSARKQTARSSIDSIRTAGG